MKESFTLLLCFCFFAVQAQKSDSLRKAIQQSKPDTHQVRLMYDLAEIIWKDGDDSLGLDYLHKSIKLAKKIKDLKGEANARILIGRIESERYVNLISGLAHVDTALQIARKLKDRRIEAFAYIRCSQLLETKVGAENERSRLYDQALAIFTELDDKSGQGMVNNEKASVHLSNGQTEAAIGFLMKARKLGEEVNDRKVLRITMPNLAVAYTQIGLYPEALEALKAAEKIIDPNQDKSLLLFTGNQRAEILERQGRYRESLSILEKNAAIHKANNAVYWLPRTYSKMARNYIALGEYDKALELNKEGARFFKETAEGENFLDQLTQLNFGKIYLHKKQYRKVIETAKLGLSYIEEGDSPLLEERAEYDRQLAESYAALGDYRNAFTHFKGFKRISDSLLNKEQIQKITAAALGFSFEKQQQADKLKFEELENEKLKQTRNFLIGFLVLGLLITAFIIWTNRRLKQKNTQLIVKNREIEEALFKGQNIERRRVASELHDNLNTKLAALRWRLEAMDTSGHSPADQKIYESSMQMLDDVYADVRLISHNLLPAELETKGMEAAFRKLMEKLGANPKTRFHYHTEGLHQRPPAKVEYQLYSVVLELINNILKHAKASEVWISLTELNNVLTLTVSDDGVGFDQSVAGSGAGLRNIISRMESIGGTIDLQSQPGEGTRITLRVDLA